MRERDWTNAAPEACDLIEAQGVTVRCLAPGGATLISGDLDAAVAVLAPGAPMIGLLEQIPDGPFALRIARDRALLCTQEPLDVSPGWHEIFALSPADDLYVPFEIAGEEAEALRNSCMSAQAGSLSAMTLFGGKECLVTRARTAIRVWIPRSETAELWTRLRVLSGV
ncbi:hypothetical protein [Paracoccus onubensis]|uniref:Sarcosine oxidase subunit gamma n=1 Tax=Paracoccus onubensis TaxID=1675788 RepID=A0A418SM89_9RHOB|nr:hypothetical protein [Paracoccus onubensis]RJE82078.1 hypothetical protein D3P04_21710 [Paracoccus onubensis]